MRWASVWLSLSALPGTASLGFRDASTGVRTSFAANEGVFVLLLRGLGWPSLEALLLRASVCSRANPFAEPVLGFPALTGLTGALTRLQTGGLTCKAAIQCRP